MRGEVSENGWWERPCGGRAVVTLALPLVMSTASWTIMHFVDRVFLRAVFDRRSRRRHAGRYLTLCDHLFATGNCQLRDHVCCPVFGSPAAEPHRTHLVARHLPRGDYHPPFVAASAVDASAVSPHRASCGGGRGGNSLLSGPGSGRRCGCCGRGIGLVLYWVGRHADRDVRGCCSGRRQYLAGLPVDFRSGRRPEMGILGTGIATSLALWAKVFVFAVILARREFRQPYGLRRGCRWDPQLTFRLLRFGGPSGLQMFVEIAAFTLLTFLMGRMGEIALAATTVAFSVNSIAFVPMLGLGIAVSAMVGQQLGANRADLAERATWTAFQLGLVYSALMSILYLAVPDWFLAAHAAGRHRRIRPDCCGLPHVAPVCRRLLRVGHGQIVFSSAVKGAGDTRFVLGLSTLIAPLPAVLGWWGSAHWGWGLVSLWCVITGWISVLAVVFYIRFRRGPWRSMRVIEIDLTGGIHTPSVVAAVDVETP